MILEKSQKTQKKNFKNFFPQIFNLTQDWHINYFLSSNGEMKTPSTRFLLFRVSRFPPPCLIERMQALDLDKVPNPNSIILQLCYLRKLLPVSVSVLETTCILERVGRLDEVIYGAVNYCCQQYPIIYSHSSFHQSPVLYSDP